MIACMWPPCRVVPTPFSSNSVASSTSAAVCHAAGGCTTVCRQQPCPGLSALAWLAQHPPPRCRQSRRVHTIHTGNHCHVPQHCARRTVCVSAITFQSDGRHTRDAFSEWLTTSNYSRCEIHVIPPRIIHFTLDPNGNTLMMMHTPKQPVRASLQRHAAVPCRVEPPVLRSLLQSCDATPQALYGGVPPSGHQRRAAFCAKRHGTEAARRFS